MVKINEGAIRKIVTETVMNLLTEERGVAFTFIENEIEKVVEYIRNYISNSKPVSVERTELSLTNNDSVNGTDRVYEFTVPDNILKDINFIEGLLLNVEIHSITVPQWSVNKIDIGELSGEGYYETKGYTEFEMDVNGVNPHNTLNQNGKIDGGSIYLNGVIINGTENFSRIREVLSHELTHTYKNYKRLSNGINYDDAKEASRYENIDKLLGNRDYFTRKATRILYRLWDHEEMEAESSTVYAYILHNHLKRENYNKDIVKTNAYLEYAEFNKTIQVLDKVIEPEEDVFVEIANVLGIKVTDAPKFKSYFINRSKKLNNEYLNRIGRCASLAYDKLEKTNQDI